MGTRRRTTTNRTTRLSALAEKLAFVGAQRGTLENLKDETSESEGPAEPAAPLREDAVTRHGFNLHASITIAADDDLGRERLCRYGLRPASSLLHWRAFDFFAMAASRTASRSRRGACRAVES
jgi:hypothetical protein